MKIYSTRHGETLWNSENRIIGITDLDLTERGVSQAIELSEKIKKTEGIQLVISSPLLRAKRTAQYCADAIGKPLIIDERLKEWNYGDYEGMDRYAEGFYESKREFAVKMKNSGESLLQFSHRIYSALDEIIEKYSNIDVLIVSHGGVCRIIETYFKNMTTDEYSGWFMKNCQLKEYDYQSEV